MIEITAREGARTPRTKYKLNTKHAHTYTRNAEADAHRDERSTMLSSIGKLCSAALARQLFKLHGGLFDRGIKHRAHRLVLSPRDHTLINLIGI